MSKTLITNHEDENKATIEDKENQEFSFADTYQINDSSDIEKTSKDYEKLNPKFNKTKNNPNKKPESLINYSDAYADSDIEKPSFQENPQTSNKENKISLYKIYKTNNPEVFQESRPELLVNYLNSYTNTNKDYLPQDNPQISNKESQKTEKKDLRPNETDKINYKKSTYIAKEPPTDSVNINNSEQILKKRDDAQYLTPKNISSQQQIVSDLSKKSETSSKNQIPEAIKESPRLLEKIPETTKSKTSIFKPKDPKLANIQNELRKTLIEYGETDIKLKMADAENKRIEAEFAAKTAELLKANEQLNKIIKLEKQQQKQLTETQSKIKELSENFFKTNQENSKLIEDLKNQKTITDDISAQNIQKDLLNFELQKEIERLKEELEKLKQNIGDEKSNYLAFEQDSENYKMQLAELSNTNIELGIAKGQFKAMIEELIRENEKLNKAIKEEKEKNLFNERQVKNYQIVSKNYEKDLERKEQELAEARERIRELERKNHEQELLIETLKGYEKKYENVFSKSTDSADSSYNSNSEVFRLMEEIKKLKKQIAELLAENNELKKQNSKLNAIIFENTMQSIYENSAIAFSDLAENSDSSNFQSQRFNPDRIKNVFSKLTEITKNDVDGFVRALNIGFESNEIGKNNSTNPLKGAGESNKLKMLKITVNDVSTLDYFDGIFRKDGKGLEVNSRSNLRQVLDIFIENKLDLFNFLDKIELQTSSQNTSKRFKSKQLNFYKICSKIIWI